MGRQGFSKEGLGDGWPLSQLAWFRDILKEVSHRRHRGELGARAQLYQALSPSENLDIKSGVGEFPLWRSRLSIQSCLWVTQAQSLAWLSGSSCSDGVVCSCSLDSTPHLGTSIC